MNAYVTLVMLGDEYVAGAIALAKSLIFNETIYDLVCMVTPDVSSDAIQRLSQFYNVIKVSFLHQKCAAMLTKRQNEMYSKWINYSFTKWQCLNLCQYKKIVYLDADHLVVKNIDNLFELQTPALCFADQYYNYYARFVHNQIIAPQTLTMFLKYNKILFRGGTCVFEPNATMYNTMLKYLNNSNYMLQHNSYHNGFDEQVLMQTIVELKLSVTQLSVMYVWNAGSYEKLTKNCEANVINYYGDRKPWHFDSNAPAPYMDLYIWRYFNALDLKNRTQIV
ncbi:glycosyl transferase [Ectropis obliqua nucleopolyhedrovirus]|uniref:Glycosyl transferase n=1 Tax=Ectropis obliqua nucleopolyhedrovirus TaxID=59376 RepID=A0EYZ0_9ABAC|nr:glycosyl transferase [Ectropis obliqua nucleopolyhedrovirus]ABI35770.1 glycosyl transferase [Ectropis obliqua nucleopolyhedrovirus]AGS47937.1 hypothetical protein R707 [Ectropis obliqua nucleopolyhedrovirus]QWV59645.1 glycosyl transferase [Ectropis obliqua nucleopolyhedrovirus]UYO72884.1 transferase [Ectropis obliqua nucleopolyhedrovirus]